MSKSCNSYSNKNLFTPNIFLKCVLKVIMEDDAFKVLLEMRTSEFDEKLMTGSATVR